MCTQSKSGDSSRCDGKLQILETFLDHESPFFLMDVKMRVKLEVSLQDCDSGNAGNVFLI